MDSEMIYLDYAAATPLDERVLAAMTPYFSTRFFNPSSPYLPAVEVRRDYEAAKVTVAAAIGARPAELIMTAGATESINLAFRGLDGHAVTSRAEHEAVLASARLKDHTLVPLDSMGLVAARGIAQAIRPDTTLVSIGLANNELGTIQPIREIAAVVAAERHRRQAEGSDRPIYLHTDASQAAGLLDLHVSRLGVDMMTLNAAKIYGPKQVGLLWRHSSVQLVPYMVGGGQEGGARSGTENVAGAVGLAEALTMVEENRETAVRRLAGLRDSLQAILLAEFPEAVISGHPKRRLANFLHISFPGLDAERLVYGLEQRGVLVATGSACAANKGTRSHVLEAIGLAPEVADGSLRITLGRYSTDENTKQAARLIAAVVRDESSRRRV